MKTPDHSHPSDNLVLLEQTIKQSLTTIQTDIHAGNTTQLQTYLELTARPGLYLRSVENHLLLCAQCPHASAIARYKTWQQRGEHVARNTTAIRLIDLLPPEQSIDRQTGEELLTIVYGVGHYFDVSQLAPNKQRQTMPFEHAVSGEALLTVLSALIQQQRLPITAEMDPRQVLRLLAQVIVPPLQQAAGQLQFSIPMQTHHQEAATCVVACHFGHGFALTGHHLRGWNADQRVFLEELEIIHRAALHTIEAIYDTAAAFA